MIFKRTEGWVLAGLLLLGAVGPAAGRPPMARMGMVHPNAGPVFPRTTMVAPVRVISTSEAMNARAMMTPGMNPMMTPGTTPGR